MCCCRCPAAGGSGTWSRRLRSPARWWPATCRAPARRTPSPPPARCSTRACCASLDRLGEDTLDAQPGDGHHARRTSTLLELLADDGLTRGAEVSVKLSAVGQALPGDGEKIALDNARAICEAARDAGTTVTLDMEDHTTTDSTLGILRELRQDFPETGAVLQAYLHRTEADCTRPAPRRARGCGCARAPTRSRSRWPSRASARSTRPTSAA